MAYIKYVTEKIQAPDLKAALSKFGELAYFDINRQKVRSNSSCSSLASIDTMRTNEASRTARSSSSRRRLAATLPWRPARTLSAASRSRSSSAGRGPTPTAAATTTRPGGEPSAAAAAVAV